MKGYDNKSGWMGWWPSDNDYRQFDTEDEYVSLYRETFGSNHN